MDTQLKRGLLDVCVLAAIKDEDSYGYRVEWDNYITVDYDRHEQRMITTRHGSGLRNVSGFDNAWDVFNDYRDNPDYIGVRLIRIDSDGSETIYASK